MTAEFPLFPEFSAAQPKFAAAYETLLAGLHAKLIYNVDFGYVKYIFANAFDAALKPRKEPFYGTAHGKTPYGFDDDQVIWALGYGISSANASLKRLKKLKVTTERQAALVELIQVCEQGKALVDLLNSAKPFIKKGKKPSDRPRKTPPRTIENTGTCPVCGGNYKLSDVGNCVDHGYTIRYGWRQGKCFGVAHLPWEVSPAGAVAYVAWLKNVLATRTKDHDFLKKKLAGQEDGSIVETPEEFEKRKQFHLFTSRTNSLYGFIEDPIKNTRIALAQVDSEVRQIAGEISAFTKRIAEWKPDLLPEEKAKKALGVI